MSDPTTGLAEGQATITPHLVIEGAAEAIDYYGRAFGARELCRMPCPKTGRVLHAALQIGASKFFICDAFPEMDCMGPRTIGGSPVTIHLQVEDADAVFNQAVAAGGTVTMPLADMFWGDRYGKVADPFGHQWSIAHRVEVLSPEQMQQRMATACF